MSGSWIAIFGIVFGQLGFIVLVFAWYRTRQRKMELQAQVQTKLIERFGSTPELVEFLQSPAGRDFVDGVQTGTALARERTLTGVRRAVLLAFLGLAFAGIWIVQQDRDWGVPALICFGLGAGYIVATLVSIAMSNYLLRDQSRPATTD